MKKYITLAVVCAMALAGCHHHHDADEEHHHHEHLQLTSYTDDWELYAEAEPFVVGDESSILAHFTKLEGFRPLAEGPVTMTFSVGGKSVTETLDNFEEEGLFTFTVKPEQSGMATIKFDIPGSTIQVEAPVFDEDEEADEYVEEHEEKSSNAVAFPKEKSWKVDFATEQASVKQLGQVIRTVAMVQLPESGERVITAKSSGVVRIQSGSLPVGTEVYSGKSLFTIEGSSAGDDNLSVRYAQAESDYNAAKKEYERKQSLAESRIVPESELLAARSEFEKAQAVYENIKSGYSAGKLNVTSPIKGFVSEINVCNGDYVQTGDRLATVSESGLLCLDAKVPARYYSLLPSVKDANFRKTSDSEVYSLADFDGKLITYGKSAADGSGLIPVHFHIKNTGEFVPGTFVQMFIKSEGGSENVSIPLTGVIEEMGDHFAYVQLNPELFEKREVTLGVSDGKNVEILSGIAEGERVVSKGAILVKLATAAGSLDAHAGHVH